MTKWLHFVLSPKNLVVSTAWLKLERSICQYAYDCKEWGKTFNKKVFLILHPESNRRCESGKVKVEQVWGEKVHLQISNNYCLWVKKECLILELSGRSWQIFVLLSKSYRLPQAKAQNSLLPICYFILSSIKDSEVTGGPVLLKIVIT